MKTILNLLVFLGIAGCASSPATNYVPVKEQLSFPPIGQITEVGLGEEMMVQGYQTTWDGIELLQRASVGMTGAYSFAPGEYKEIGKSSQGTFYEPTRSARSGAVSVSALGDPFQYIMIKNDGQFCGVAVYDLYSCTRKAEFVQKDVGGIGLESFQKTLIYSGRVDDTVRITYREYSDGMARPAFANDVEYDLSESTIIGYQGAELEIIEATNRSIEFILLKNFNK